MEKRGFGHIEFILSFILFFSAVAFALYFFNPVENNRLVDSSLGYLFREIEKNSSVNMKSFSVVITEGAIIGPHSDPIGIEVKNIPSEMKVYVEDKNGVRFEANRVGDNVYVKPFTSWNGVQIIYLKFSEEFEEKGLQSGVINEDYYEIASSTSSDLISEKRILKLKDSYYTDYIGLREKFNIPSRVDFAFSLNFGSDSIQATKEIPSGLKVFADKKRFNVIRNDGMTTFGDLSVEVW